MKSNVYLARVTRVEHHFRLPLLNMAAIARASSLSVKSTQIITEFRSKTVKR